jgi:signal transduction histidine kinase
VQAAPPPDDERERLRALLRYDILDTGPEQAFDDLTALASQICGVPIALVSLIDEHRQWFKSRVGLGATETPRELAFCAHAILQDDVFEVPNALDDPRFADNPLVAGDPDIRFYAGTPLVTNDGFKLGTLCVIDRIPRQLGEDQLTALRILGRQVIAQLELRKTAAMLTRSLLDLQAARAPASVLVDDPAWQGNGEVQRAFLAHVTHDLRTPLNAILGFGQLLAEDGEIAETERREIANNINLAGGYMLRLVDDILDVGRLESGTGSFANEPVELEALARATLETLRPLALANGNRVSLAYTSAQRTIDGDPTQLQKVLFNLLSNAFKYTHDGAVRLTIADDGPQRLRIEVADTGIGMSADQRLRLFRPFAQVHKVQNQQSTGLGLHLTRVLCERMGGAVTVRSEPALGTTFTVWLPTTPPGAAPQGSAIAVAEGDPDVRAALQLALGRVAPLVFIEGVAEVLWTLVDRRWRAVIVDLSSPGAEEVELLRAVDRMCREHATPLAAALRPGEPGEPGVLPQWRIDAGPAALHRLLEPAAEPVGARLATPSPLR